MDNPGRLVKTPYREIKIALSPFYVGSKNVKLLGGKSRMIVVRSQELEKNVEVLDKECKVSVM
jgi:hypothetical protein